MVVHRRWPPLTGGPVYEVVSTRIDPEAHMAASHWWIQLAVTSETKNELYKMMEDFTERMNQELRKQEVLLAAQREQELLAQKQAAQENALNSKLLSINSQHLDKEKKEVKNITEPQLNIKLEISSVNAITPDLPTEELEYSLIMGNEELSTIPEKELDKFIKSSVEDLIPILRESDDTFGSDSKSVLPSSNDFSSIFEEKSNIESKDSYVSNLDKPVLLVTPLSDANKDECFDREGVIDEIDAFLDMDISTDIETLS
ncbi:hypothetical protein Tco_0687533 [Tanacetum coccineum]